MRIFPNRNRHVTGGVGSRRVADRAELGAVAEFKAFVEGESRKFGSVIERANIRLTN